MGPCHCGGLCCPPVPVSDEEVQRILAVTGGTLENHFERTNAGTFTRTQRVRVGPEALEANRCHFLDLKTLLCTVYSLRPQICRDFDH